VSKREYDSRWSTLQRKAEAFEKRKQLPEARMKGDQFVVIVAWFLTRVLLALSPMLIQQGILCFV
jgi:hypothetical protein